MIIFTNINLSIVILCSYLQINFQLYIKAKDYDLVSHDDFVDNVVIDQTLEANTGFTGMKKFTGILNRVSFRARFRVMCQRNYYGARCDTHCVARNDNFNGHYTCNRRNGSIQCLEGFENPNNNCRDSEFIMPQIVMIIEISYS
jgi:hypothetical protein